MFDESYRVMKTQLNTVIDNIDEIIENINYFNNNCLGALNINNNTNYKNSVTNIKNKLLEQKKVIKDEIIVDIETQIAN